jgi:hypothetical protein
VLYHKPYHYALALLQLAEADTAAATNMAAGLRMLERLGALVLFCSPAGDEQRQKRRDDGNDVLQLEAYAVLARFDIPQQLQQLRKTNPRAAFAGVKQLCREGKLNRVFSENKDFTSAFAGAGQHKALHIVSRFALNEQQQQPVQRNMLLDRAAARGRWEPADAGARWQALQYKVAAHVRWALQHSAALQGLHLALLQPVVENVYQISSSLVGRLAGV